MGQFLTSASRVEQLPRKTMYRLLDNELYQDDDGSIYLAWRNYETDNFTWLNHSGYDIRCSHIHDICCEYHQIIKVKLTKSELETIGYLRYYKGKTVCENIPINFLEVLSISRLNSNNIFYRMLKSADNPKTPKHIQLLYRAGVSLNVKWLFTGKRKINLNTIY